MTCPIVWKYPNGKPDPEVWPNWALGHFHYVVRIDMENSKDKIWGPTGYYINLSKLTPEFNTIEKNTYVGSSLHDHYLRYYNTADKITITVLYTGDKWNMGVLEYYDLSMQDGKNDPTCFNQTNAGCPTSRSGKDLVITEKIENSMKNYINNEKTLGKDIIDNLKSPENWDEGDVIDIIADYATWDWEKYPFVVQFWNKKALKEQQSLMKKMLKEVSETKDVGEANALHKKNFIQPKETLWIQEQVDCLAAAMDKGTQYDPNDFAPIFIGLPKNWNKYDGDGKPLWTHIPLVYSGNNTLHGTIKSNKAHGSNVIVMDMDDLRNLSYPLKLQLGCVMNDKAEKSGISMSHEAVARIALMTCHVEGLYDKDGKYHFKHFTAWRCVEKTFPNPVDREKVRKICSKVAKISKNTVHLGGVACDYSLHGAQNWVMKKAEKMCVEGFEDKDNFLIGPGNWVKTGFLTMPHSEGLSTLAKITDRICSYLRKDEKDRQFVASNPNDNDKKTLIPLLYYSVTDTNSKSDHFFKRQPDKDGKFNKETKFEKWESERKILGGILINEWNIIFETLPLRVTELEGWFSSFKARLKELVEARKKQPTQLLKKAS